jgi:tetratricopeptide (TPR) repeat protein
MLKALGLTMWGLIAFGLLIVFFFVGYQAALKYRPSSAPVVGASSARPRPIETQPSVARETGTQAPTRSVAPVLSSPPLTHQSLQNAAASHQYEMAIEYGRQLVASDAAGPEDLVVIAESYGAVNDCANARVWGEKAREAFHAAGRESSESLRRITKGCGTDHDKPRIVLDAAQKERMDRLLNTLNFRAQADRKRLPQLEEEAATATSGESYVRLGELYYGFGEYAHTITAIQRGLDKGKVVHLDEAYVYLGLSEQAVGDLEEAHKAFAKLKDVPGISPRVLLLWTLYAETQL